MHLSLRPIDEPAPRLLRRCEVEDTDPPLRHLRVVLQPTMEHSRANERGVLVDRNLRLMRCGQDRQLRRLPACDLCVVWREVLRELVGVADLRREVVFSLRTGWRVETSIECPQCEISEVAQIFAGESTWLGT